jgi:hypothetical protein
VTSEIDKIDARNRLVSDGSASYVEALAAIAEFQRLVIDKSRTAMRAHLGDLAAAAGVTLRSNDLKDWINPASPQQKDWNHTYAGLGVGIDLNAKSCTLYSGLYWNTDKQVPNPLVVMSSLAFVKDPTCDRALEKFEQRASGCELPTKFWKCELVFCEPIGPRDTTLLEDKLPVVIRKWVKAFKSVDGVQALLRT